MGFGKRLKEFSLTAYFEHRDFAADLGTSPSMLSMWFTDKKVPGGDYLQRIYHSGCSTDWLFSGKGSMIADNEAGHKLREKLKLPEPKTEDVESITYEKMVQVPFVKDLRLLLRSDITELFEDYFEQKKHKVKEVKKFKPKGKENK
jgi:transcriptional regulator with XRE-family HTH domain